MVRGSELKAESLLMLKELLPSPHLTTVENYYNLHNLI